MTHSTTTKLISSMCNVTPAQRHAFARMFALTGLEPMHIDEINDGTMSFEDAWNSNIRFLEDMIADVQRLRNIWVVAPHDDDGAPHTKDKK